jgi:SAM-dependent methyltransferase
LRRPSRASVEQFRARCLADSRLAKHQNDLYLADHIDRFHETYRVCGELLSNSPSQRVLSAGAGNAYVETQLKNTLEATVSVIEFAETIEHNKEHYSSHGFKTYPADLATGMAPDIAEKFDLVLSCEVLEHLPLPPVDHIGVLAPLLAPGGHLVVTTPNRASLGSILKLLLGRPIDPDPSLAFLPVRYENEGIHRRVYVESEIVVAMTRNSIEHLRTLYFWSRRSFASKRDVLIPLEWARPSFRPQMLLVGRNCS